MKISTQRLILCSCAIILHVMLGHVRCDWLTTCGNCRCKWNSGKRTADCKNMTLKTIPEYLSSELQVLDLSLNKIPAIEDGAFLKADLQNLHKLFMRNCTLERVHSHGLKGLGILIEIDLSNNLLKALSRDMFITLVKVRSVILNCNLLESLESGIFRNLQYLHKVELKENRISTVSTDVFVNVPLLSQIFLNGNKLKFLRKETFEKLKRLTSLSLESNPWNCTCELRAFRDFALKRNLYTPPTSCYYPATLRGTLWTDSAPEAFACKPKIIYPSRGASINTSKDNVTLICRVHASPNTLIAWDYNKQMYSSNYQARVHIQLIREENDLTNSGGGGGGVDKDIGRDIFISRLTIIGAEKSDEGIYTCLAENAGGKDEVQMNLLVQKHNHQNLLLQNNLVIVICLMVLGLLSASIFLAMVTCCIYKRFKAINHRPTDDQQHQHHQQKRNFGSLNMVNSVNDSYHRNGDSNYVEIKQTKVSDDNFDGILGSGGGTGDSVDADGTGTGGVIVDGSTTINEFTDLKNASRIYCENNSQGSIHQQTAQTNCSSLQGLEYHQDEQYQHYQQQPHKQQQQLQQQQQQQHRQQKQQERQQEQEQYQHIQQHKMEHSGEYQPDLLPHMPQSISFNNASLYSSVNYRTSSENQQQHQQQQQQQQQQLLKHQQQTSLQLQSHHHQAMHHPENQTDDHLLHHRYANNTLGINTSITGNNSSKMSSNSRSIGGIGTGPTIGIGAGGKHIAQSRENLHYGIIGSGIGGSSSTNISIDDEGKLGLIGGGGGGRAEADDILGTASPIIMGSTSTLVRQTYQEKLQRLMAAVDDVSGSDSYEIGPAPTATATAAVNAHFPEHHSTFPRHSIVRTSPSLNFLTNYYQRRELL